VEEEAKRAEDHQVSRLARKANNGLVGKKSGQLQLLEYSMAKGFRSRVTKYIVKNHGT